MKRSKYSDFQDFRKKISAREINQVEFQHESLLSVALVFPNTYSVGMANLGFQSIYRLFNEHPSVRCERAFFYDDFPEITRTLETGDELRNFDIVAFSIAYELDFPNLVQILMNSGITPFSSRRDGREPLIMAGGAIAFMNPTPIAPFIDAFYLGEIEPQLPGLLNLLTRLKTKRKDRIEMTAMLAEQPGIYVPAKFDHSTTLNKNFQSPQQKSPQYSPIISPFSHFKNMFLVEAGRGCGRQCYFCAASHIYHPFRIFRLDSIMNVIETQCQHTRKVGLIGAALSDYPKLLPLCEILVEQRYELGLSSLRLDMIGTEFLEILARGKVKTLTFAPEAGTEQLRNLIHKNLTDGQIMDAAAAIADSSINQVKLYFMIGLPGEKDEDLQGMVHLVNEIFKVLNRNKKIQNITVSVNTFIPKPFTPFQWSVMESVSEIRRKRKFLQRELKKIPGIQFTRKSVKEEILQGIFSLGDQRVAEGIYFKLNKGTDWQSAWQAVGLSTESILHQPKTFQTRFPWDFMEYRISRDRLWKVWSQVKK